MRDPVPNLRSVLTWTINTSMVTPGAFLSSSRSGHEVSLQFNDLIRAGKCTAGPSSHSLRSIYYRI